ncbi:MAG: hypothetical protein LBU07_03925 [Coriobacteriales bacterium]|jgi:hypothetical protein|nr:hypothetical protein [Coriobacteriales bacterium]
MKSEAYMLNVRGHIVPGTPDNIKEAIKESYEQALSPEVTKTVFVRRELTSAEQEALKEAKYLDLSCL